MVPAMSGTFRTPDLLHLVRLDGDGLQGWQLRFPNWHPLGAQTLYFADSFYGGPDEAYRAARIRRDADFQAAGLPLRQKGNTRHAHNKTGLVGVMLSFAPRRRGVSAFSWTALWSEDLKPRRKAFSVRKLGFEGALDAAIAWRCAKTGLKFSDEQRERALGLRYRVIEHARRSGVSPFL